MKYILSFLTIALAFAANTASAAFTYEVIRTGYDQYNQPGQGNDSFYKIRITGGTGDIFLSDWIDNIGDSHQEDNLTQKGIDYYGYYYVNSNDQSKINTGVIMELGVDSNPFPIETVKSPWNDNVIIRYAYKLGTFTEGDEVEIYMADENGSVRSNTTMYMGAYGDGVSNVDQLVFYQNNYNWNLARELMPLAALDTGNGHRVFFGIYGEESAGAPLPGGLSIALVSGLFALGFYFVRRRKAIVS